MVRLCHFCHQPGHFARNCPQRASREVARPEAPGRSTSVISRTSCLEAQEMKPPEELTEEELEALLARCRLQKEKQMLGDSMGYSDATVSTVTPLPQPDSGSTTGPLLYCDLKIEGVPVNSMVDCGSQATIISRSLLHRVSKQFLVGNKPLPELRMPSVRLYGKDGPAGRNQLPITAEVDLLVKAGGKAVTVPVFVQPSSTQDFLLGTNASLPLGFKFLDGAGRPLTAQTKLDTGSTATVSLLEACTIPSRKCCLLTAKVSGKHATGDQFLFEPKGTQLPSMGVSTMDSLVTLLEEKPWCYLSKIFKNIVLIYPLVLS